MALRDNHVRNFDAQRDSPLGRPLKICGCHDDSLMYPREVIWLRAQDRCVPALRHYLIQNGYEGIFVFVVEPPMRNRYKLAKLCVTKPAVPD